MASNPHEREPGANYGNSLNRTPEIGIVRRTAVLLGAALVTWASIGAAETIAKKADRAYAGVLVRQADGIIDDALEDCGPAPFESTDRNGRPITVTLTPTDTGTSVGIERSNGSTLDIEVSDQSLDTADYTLRTNPRGDEPMLKTSDEPVNDAFLAPTSAGLVVLAVAETAQDAASVC